MKLIKKIKLDFGNDALADWEQECEKINAANKAAKNNPVYEKIDGWEAREVFDAKWSEDGKERISDHVNVIKNSFDARILGLDFSALPQEGVARVKNYLVERKVILADQEVELQELPPKPVVKVLNKSSAYDVIKAEQPKIKIQAYDLSNFHFDENLGQYVRPENFYITTYHDRSNVVSIMVEAETKQEYDSCKGLYVYNHHYAAVTKTYKKYTYKVLVNRLEVWEDTFEETRMWLPDGTEYFHPAATNGNDNGNHRGWMGRDSNW